MNKEEKVQRYLAGKQKKTEFKRNIFEKLKLTWYLNDPFSKWWYILGSLALIFVIIRLIAGKGLW